MKPGVEFSAISVPKVGGGSSERQQKRHDDSTVLFSFIICWFRSRVTGFVWSGSHCFEAEAYFGYSLVHGDTPKLPIRETSRRVLEWESKHAQEPVHPEIFSGTPFRRGTDPLE